MKKESGNSTPQDKNQYALYTNDEGLQCIQLLNGKWIVVRESVGGSISRITFSEKPNGFDNYELVGIERIDGIFNSEYHSVFHVFEGVTSINEAVDRLKQHVIELEELTQDGWDLAHEATDVLHLEIGFMPYKRTQA